MSLLMITASRKFHSSLSRRSFPLITSRFLSTQSNTTTHQTHDQQIKGDYPSPQPRRRYRYYLLSIAGGALIGTIYTLWQSRKYEGLMPEYVSNQELIDRKAMEARPQPPPITKHITFDSPSKVNFPFKITLYQYITWFVLFKKNKNFYVCFFL
jgi:hypothetical protein